MIPEEEERKRSNRTPEEVGKRVGHDIGTIARSAERGNYLSDETWSGPASRKVRKSPNLMREPTSVVSREISNLNSSLPDEALDQFFARRERTMLGSISLPSTICS